MRLPTILISLALLTPSAAAPQSKAKPKQSAFGFTKGMTLKEVQAVAKVEKIPGYRWMYGTMKPPTPVGYFMLYVVVVPPKIGVCRVVAVTDKSPPDSPPAKAAIERITEALTAKYGPPTDAPEQGDNRQLGAWKDPLGPGTVIEMSKAIDDFKTGQSVAVTYYFSNHASCAAEELQGL